MWKKYPATQQGRRHSKNEWNPTWTKKEVQVQNQESLEWGYNGLATITKKQISIEALLKKYEDVVKQIPE